MTHAKPTIVVKAEDHARLTALVRAAMGRMPDLASELADELDRADVLPQGSCAEHIVCMGSEVEFRDETTSKIHKVTLVYPQEADILSGKVSVLTPIGTALIGLRAGQSIAWETPAGDPRSLTVIAVRSY